MLPAARTKETFSIKLIPRLLSFKTLLIGIGNGGLNDESVEGMANPNLHVMRSLGLPLEDDVPDHSVLVCSA